MVMSHKTSITETDQELMALFEEYWFS